MGYKEAEVMGEEMLDAPPAWNEVLDLMIETEDGRMIPEAAHGRRKRRREDDIRPEKCEQFPPRFHGGHVILQCRINGRE